MDHPESYSMEDAPTPPRHTQFLDLTNGEGGERGENHYMHDGEETEDEEDHEHQPSRHSAGAPANRAKPSVHLANSGEDATFDPNTHGRVVETGQEATGRWTQEEHEAFLVGLKLYGKEWKKVAAKVGTRTVVQTRTHAQKYFQKLQKVMDSGDPQVDEVPMGSNRSTPASTKKKRPSTTVPTSTQPTPSHGSAAHVQSAASLISNMSGTEQAPGASPAFAKPQPPSKYSSTAASNSHGFAVVSSLAEAPTAEPTRSHPPSFPMKIVAPAHNAAAMRGKFPEPSPAACGKRKLAEIAAARMLAGVADLEDVRPKGPSDKVSEDGTATPPPDDDADKVVHMMNNDTLPIIPSGNSRPNKPGFGLSLQIVNPETLGVSYETQKKKRKDGQMSPQTPWEGQLAALVSEEKKKGPAKESQASEVPPPPVLGTTITTHTLHPVVGPGSAYNRNPLHKAVCEMDLAVIQSELASRPSEFFQRADCQGYCPMHTACALCLKDMGNSRIATEIVRMMVTAGADVSVADSNGNTPLHWVARAGDKVTAEFLLLKASPKDAKNDRGETPLHWALRAGRRGLEVASVLIDNGARPAVWSKEFKRPIEVAADGFHDEEGSVMDLKKLVTARKRLNKDQRRVLKEAMEERREARSNLLMLSAQSRTLVLHHPECQQHMPKSSSDWENPDRVSSILDKLLGKGAGAPPVYDHEITLSQEFERAKLDLLSRIHSTEYLNFVNELSKDLERQHRESGEGADEETEEPAKKPPVVPFTPMVQRSMIKVAESSVKLGQHSDTSFSVGSLRAARRAAGAVQHAVDCVLVGRNRNAFCVVRPPGHHAGINGLLDGGESCGFCIFNSVAAGAMHAISDERLLCDRCAIVDIDVHHGNGTEEIVRKCHDPGKLFFFSIHLYDNERKGKRETKSFQYKFYPGTGDEDDVALNIINVPITPLWKEKEAPAAAGNTHNTRHRTRQTRATKEGDDGSDTNSGKGGNSDAESDCRPSSGTSTPTTPNSNPTATSGRMAYRRAIQNRLLPALRAFNPDLILISAGFDACKGDVGNAKHEFGGKERMGIDLEPEDYAWTTRKVLEIADICCQGRVVSVLEGGYGRTPAHTTTGSPPVQANAALDKSAFSDCAIRHVHAMIDPYDTEARFGNSA
eukprot:Nitzschia sp. Nitz4//scaffold93_size78505//34867//38603//NITZ4_005420-RA/size78505-augustus-gene-0.49-mRNA-1//-1//CDS//3329560288//4309//frame0